MPNILFIDGGGAEVEFLQTATDVANLAAYTFVGQNLGAASADRYIIVAYAGIGTNGITSVSVGGVGATLLTPAVSGSNFTTGIAIAAVPSGATGDIVVDLAGSSTSCTIAVFRAVKLLSATAFHSVQSTDIDPSIALNIPAAGFAIGMGQTGSSAGAATWTGLTERSEVVVENSVATSACDNLPNAETGRTVGITFVGSSAGASAYASWG